MSESTRPSQREAATGSSATPRAIIHKKILDLAEERPNTTITELAEIVNGASAELVEHVLEEYGDPAQVSEKDGEIRQKSHRETGTTQTLKWSKN